MANTTNQNINNENAGKIVIFGGNGFVGTAIARLLVQQGKSVFCVSRSGTKPKHLENQPWAGKVEWIKNDGFAPDPILFSNCEAIISCVGSPPIPATTSKSYNRQLMANGTTNINIINAAAKNGVTRLVLLSAEIPAFIDKEWFAYAMGKKMMQEAAKHFCLALENRTVTVLKPGLIFGTRFLKNGNAVRLDKFFRPLAKLQRYLPQVLKWLIPVSLLSVDEVASAAAKAAIDKTAFNSGFFLLRADDIAQ